MGTALGMSPARPQGVTQTPNIRSQMPLLWKPAVGHWVFQHTQVCTASPWDGLEVQPLELPRAHVNPCTWPEGLSLPPAQ